MDGEPPFRVKGTEKMECNEVKANAVAEGDWVKVRCDATRKIVVLERVPTETLADQVERKKREALAKEEALLEDRTPR